MYYILNFCKSCSVACCNAKRVCELPHREQSVVGSQTERTLSNRRGFAHTIRNDKYQKGVSTMQ